MSYNFTDETETTRSVTKAVADYFLLIKSGWKTPSEVPIKNSHKKAEASSESICTFRSLAISPDDIRKIQKQGLKRRNRAKLNKMKGHELSQRSTLLDQSRGKADRTIISYEDMILQRIGVKGPINPYQIVQVKLSDSVADDFSSMAETILSHNCGSNMLQEKQEALLKLHNDTCTCSEIYLEFHDLAIIKDQIQNWRNPNKWTMKRITIRALTSEKFRRKYRTIENEVVQFQDKSESIFFSLEDVCEGIFAKQNVTRDFLQYTYSYSRMLEPIENELLSIKKQIQSPKFGFYMIDSKNINNKFLDTKNMLQELPEFVETLLTKRKLAESNLYELNQFCALVENHKNLETKLLEHFESMHLQYNYHDYLMQEYVYKLRFHFDLLRKQFLETNWLRRFSKFLLALKRSNWENLEAHQTYANILSRKKQITRYIEQIEDGFRRIEK